MIAATQVLSQDSPLLPDVEPHAPPVQATAVAPVVVGVLAPVPERERVSAAVSEAKFAELPLDNSPACESAEVIRFAREGLLEGVTTTL
jgi:hypothetical protein